MMLGFVVRQCAIELGHAPDAAELASWANGSRDASGAARIFGRSITTEEARVILRHPERMVTIHPQWQMRAVAITVVEEPAKVFELSAFRRSR